MSASDHPRGTPGRILVTGANGFLGSAVSAALDAAGHEVLRGTRLAGERSETQAWVGYGDIGPHTRWGPALERVGTVVHLAGLAHLPDDQAASAAATFHHVNTEGTAALAAAAAAHGVRRFILMSSILVLGNASRAGPFVEDDPPRPETAYAQSKLDSETALRTAARGTGMEWVILRPPMVYGAAARGNFRRLVRIVASGLPLPLGRAVAPRTFIGIDNLASAVVRTTSHPRAANEIFHIGDAESTSTAGMIRLIAGALGRSPRLVSLPPALVRAPLQLMGKGRDVARLFDPLEVASRRICELLDWSAPVPLAEGVRRAVRGMF